MSTSTLLMTAEELARLPDDGYRSELVKGEPRRMAPTGGEHGSITVRLTWRLAQYVDTHGLGVVLAAETGFLLESDPDTVRAPDVAFVRRECIPSTGIPKGFWPGPPDLAVEVVSPNDTYVDIDEKVADWLTAGTAMVWVINPQRRTVTVHRAAASATVLDATDTLDGAEVVPGFRCEVAEFFV